MANPRPSPSAQGEQRELDLGEAYMNDAEYRAMTKRTIRYEWVWEEMPDGPDGDVVEGHTVNGPCPCPFSGYGEFGLIRDYGSNAEGVTDRQWAYVDDAGSLPERFSGGAKIPQSKRNEWDRMRGKIALPKWSGN